MMLLFAATPSYGLVIGDSTHVAADTTARAGATLAAILGGFMQWMGTGTELAPIPLLGAGHFLQRDWLKGSAFLGSEIGLLLLRDRLQARIRSSDFALYPNHSTDSTLFRARGISPLSNSYQQCDDLARMVLVNVYLIDLYSSYQSLHEKGYSLNKVRLEASVPDLMLSPFKPKYLANPWVFIPSLLGAAATFLAEKGNRSLSAAEQVTMFNTSFSPSQAARFVAGVHGIRYLMVAGGEEMFFRGVIHTELTERTNPTLAVAANSVLFGLWHVPNNGWLNGLTASLFGLYLGYRYENNGYDLGEAIASHFWLDWAAKTVAFLCHPADNSIVYSINWRF